MWNVKLSKWFICFVIYELGVAVVKRALHLLFICSFLLIGCSEEDGTPSIEIPAHENAKIQLSVEGKKLMKDDVRTETYVNRVTDTRYSFRVESDGEQIGTIHVTTRELDNGDVFVFTKLENNMEEPLKVYLNIPLNDVNRYEVNDWDQRHVEHQHDKTTGVDETTGPIGLMKVFNYDEEKFELVLSKNYQSRKLTKKYEDGRKSIVRELIKEEKRFYTYLNNDQLVISLPMASSGKDISESWLLLSSDRLFEKEENLQKWIDFHLDNYKAAKSWLTAEGPYKKLPWSIEPGTKLGYGRNLGLIQDKTALDSFEQYRERYYYDLVLNSMADLLAFKNEKGTAIWETEYTSTWLKKAYGTTAPYIDTRHNENIALFLTRVGNLLNIEELKNAITIYGDYLIEQVEIGNTIQVGEGYLIADYFSPYDQSQKTHASLNHILGGVNLLLDCYSATGNEKYLDVALHIIKGVEELGEQWIRDSGDLWYQVNPDLTFTGNDYELLTLIDLLTTQEKLEEIQLERNQMLDRFIRSKASYLVREEKEMYDYVKEMLVNQGFGDILKEE
jgi:hypothetical protein